MIYIVTNVIYVCIGCAPASGAPDVSSLFKVDEYDSFQSDGYCDTEWNKRKRK